MFEKLLRVRETKFDWNRIKKARQLAKQRSILNEKTEKPRVIGSKLIIFGTGDSQKLAKNVAINGGLKKVNFVTALHVCIQIIVPWPVKWEALPLKMVSSILFWLN